MSIHELIVPLVNDFDAWLWERHARLQRPVIVGGLDFEGKVIVDFRIRIPITRLRGYGKSAEKDAKRKRAPDEGPSGESEETSDLPRPRQRVRVHLMVNEEAAESSVVATEDLNEEDEVESEEN